VHSSCLFIIVEINSLPNYKIDSLESNPMILWALDDGEIGC